MWRLGRPKSIEGGVRCGAGRERRMGDRAPGRGCGARTRLSGLTLEMPPGLIGRLRGIPLCADAQAAAGTCGAASRVGTATAGAGPGSAPFFLAR